MNYLQMFAKGGKTKGTDIIKGIQKILGVDDNQMAELWQVGINKYGSEEGIAQALNEATKGLTPQSSPDEVKAAVATVFSTGSEMFKCGGKLQKLAKRFAKGGSVDCGCNGTKLKQNGGLLNNRFYNLPDRVYNEKGVFSGYINGPEDIAYIQSRKEPRDWTVQSPTPQARLNNTTNQSRMLWNPEMLPEPYYKAYVITENPEGKGTVTHIPMNQDGGEVRLTRRQALDLSKERKGYDASGYAQAMANARASLRENSNLTGKELTYAARRMVAGIYPNNEGEDLNLPVNAPMLTKPEAINAPTLIPAMASKNVRDNYNVRENNAIDQMVKVTIQGKYGNGAARKEALGEYYKLVQEKVNAILRQKSNKPQQTTNKSTTNKPQPAYVNQNLAKANAGNNDYSQPGSLRNVITYESDSLIAGYDENGNYYTIVPSKNTKYRRDKNGNLQVVVESPQSISDKYIVRYPMRQQGGELTNTLKCGGKVEKAQGGESLTPYTGEINQGKYNGPVKEWWYKTVDNNSTLRHLNQAFNNFKQSAPGKVISFLTPDVTSENGIVGSLYGFDPKTKVWDLVTKRTVAMQAGNPKYYTMFKAVGENFPSRALASNKSNLVERGVTEFGEPYVIRRNELAKNSTEKISQSIRELEAKSAYSSPAEWATSGSGSIKVRGRKTGGQINK